MEDSWESVHPMMMQPLKVIQGLLTSEEDAWFITVLRPCRGSSELRPAEWSVGIDERGRPVLSMGRTGDISCFHMPD
ncbi:hypothetical protein PAAL109150_16485 [Paenibacillus alkaliterrae]